MSDSWLDSKVVGQYGALKPQADALRDLFSSSITPQSAAGRLASTVLASDDADWRLWSLLFDVAAELPDKHPMITDLFLALRRMGGPSRESKQDAARDCVEGGAEMVEHAGRLMRCFPSDWRDRLWAWRDRSQPQEGEEGTPPSQQFLNFTAFSAQLLGKEPALEHRVFAFFALRDTLEADWDESYPGLAPSSEPDRRGTLGVDLSAAAQWILHAGSIIHKTDNGMISDGWRNGLGHRTKLWGGPPGFSPGRWALWKSRFLSAREIDGLSDDAQSWWQRRRRRWTVSKRKLSHT